MTANYSNSELPERMLARKRAQGFPDAEYTDYCLKDLSRWDRRTMDPGGKILQYRPETGVTEEFCALPSLLYAQSLLVDSARGHAFGHTIPDNHFYHIDLTSRKLSDHGRISDYAFHHMVVTPDGVCYASWLDRADGSMKLQRFDPQSLEFTLPGRLAEGGRVTSMDEDEDGIFWISAGYPHTHLIRFDPDFEGPTAITNCGPINASYERGYVHASRLYENKLYLGETDGFSPSLHVVDLNSL